MIELRIADITTLPVDAIVNAANSALAGGGGVDGAIHAAAGPELMRELRRFDGCPPGEAVLTAGYRLPARYVIHAVGPVWLGGAVGEDAVLERAYRSAFREALAHPDIRTIAFPAISTGVFRYPREAAALIALRVMTEYEDRFERIIAALYDEQAHAAYVRALAQLSPHAPNA